MRRWLRAQRRIEGWILAGSILAMAGLMIANVLARTLLGFSLAATEELAQFLIVLICFVGLSYAASQRRHIRMTALVEALPPHRRRSIDTAVSIATSALLVLLGWTALRYALLVADLGSVSPVLSVPLAAVYLVAPLGLWLGAVHYALDAWARLTGRVPEAERAAAEEAAAPEGHA